MFDRSTEECTSTHTHPRSETVQLSLMCSATHFITVCHVWTEAFAKGQQRRWVQSGVFQLMLRLTVVSLHEHDLYSFSNLYNVKSQVHAGQTGGCSVYIPVTLYTHMLARSLHMLKWDLVCRRSLFKDISVFVSGTWWTTFLIAVVDYQV